MFVFRNPDLAKANYVQCFGSLQVLSCNACTDLEILLLLLRKALNASHSGITELRVE